MNSEHEHTKFEQKTRNAKEKYRSREYENQQIDSHYQNVHDFSLPQKNYGAGARNRTWGVFH